MIKLMKRGSVKKVLFAGKINKPKFSNEAEILRSELFVKNNKSIKIG